MAFLSSEQNIKIALVIDFYEDLEDYETTKKRKMLIVLDDMVGNMETIKRLSPIVTKVSLRGGTFIISLVFISQSYFEVLKTIKLNVTLYFIMKISKLYEDYTKEPNSLLVNDINSSSINPLTFTKNLL